MMEITLQVPEQITQLYYWAQYNPGLTVLLGFITWYILAFFIVRNLMNVTKDGYDSGYRYKSGLPVRYIEDVYFINIGWFVLSPIILPGYIIYRLCKILFQPLFVGLVKIKKS